jgi:hypothetical protein
LFARETAGYDPDADDASDVVGPESTNAIYRSDIVTEPLDLPRRLRAWSYRRQHLGRAAPRPAEALRAVVGVYSSHPTAPLSLLSRCQSLDAEGFAALEQQREALRVPTMRGSIFLVPAGTAPRLFAATRLPLEQHARRLRFAGLDADEYERLKPRVLEQLQEPVTSGALQEALPIAGRLMTVVRIMALEGLVLRLGTSLRTDNLRYVATEAWLGQPLGEGDPLASLQGLAGEYLRAFGPARVADFAWWSGATRRRAAAALGAADVVDLGGGLLLPADEQAAFEGVEPVDPDALDVLPKWDAYTMGHAPDGRQRLVDDQHLAIAYSAKDTGAGATAGDGLPLVLRGGRAVATWAHRFTGNRMLVTVTPFESDALSRAVYERAFDEVGQLLGATTVEVTAAPA